MVKFVKANFKDEKDSKGNLSDLLSGPVVNIFSQEKGNAILKRTIYINISMGIQRDKRYT